MANHFIRTGALGLDDGSDWTNAWPDFASVTWTRGDTYYVADGVYAETVTLTKAVAGASYIYILKATATAHVTEDGWNAGYGDGQAETGRWSIQTGYWYISGVGRTTETSGYGFKVTNTVSGTNAFGKLALTGLEERELCRLVRDGDSVNGE